MWLPIVAQLGFKPTLVILKSDKFMTLVENQVPEACVVLAGSDWRVLGSRVPGRFTDSSCVAFVDGRVNNTILDLSESMEIPVVIGRGRPRRQPKGWLTHGSSHEHHRLGGVTTTVSHITTCVNFRATNINLDMPDVPSALPRDLSTLMCSMIPSRFLRKAPATEKLPNFTVCETSRQVYHGGGWLPPSPTLSTRVLTPYALGNGRWAIRPLDPTELLQAYDVPEAQVASFLPVVGDPDFPEFVPGKSLFAGASIGCKALRAVFNEGGGSSFSSSSLQPSALRSPSIHLIHRKERKQFEDRLQDVRENKRRRVVGPTSPVATKQCGKGKKTRLELREMLGDFDGMFDTPRVDITAPVESNDTADERPTGTTTASNAGQILEDIERNKREMKATKSDDADVPIYLWTEHYLEKSKRRWIQAAVKNGISFEEQTKRVERALEVLRHHMFIRIWKRRLLRSFIDWFNGQQNQIESALEVKHSYNSSTGESEYSWSESGRAQYQSWHRDRIKSRAEDWEASTDAMGRAANASWWEWLDGSRPFHWRWPKWYRRTIRDGLEVYLDKEKVPSYKVAQRGEQDEKIREAIKKKLNKVRARRYITKDFVVSLTSFFAVPKGEHDIRMVYDGTKSGLNDAMWVPRFALPTIDTHLRSIEEGTFLADVDVGECFLNFPLHRSLRSLAGVDLTQYFPNPDGSRVWECWHRALMGVKSSPYQAVQGMAVVEEVIRGDPTNSKNVFKWNAVRFNCPGDESYDSDKPWMSKVFQTKDEDGRIIEEVIAADLVGYVDDLRPSGSSREEAWLAARRTASIMNFLGIQDAARKRRDSSQTPGAWAGSVVLTRPEGVFVMVDQAKWDKAKKMIAEVEVMCNQNPTAMNRKRLEEIRGFLNYVVRTYPALKPYLTGFHITIDGWRKDRDKDGWRVKATKPKPNVNEDADDDDEDDDGEEDDTWQYESSKIRSHQDPDAPRCVQLKPRLSDDISALKYLMSDPTPRPRRVRGTQGRKVIYCFGDASGSGFGFTMEQHGILHYHYGQWSTIADGKSSNWREARNLLEGLKLSARDHSLQGLEVFIFTDNTTTESAFWKGTSKSRELSEIILEMRRLEMTTDLILHVVHVSGKRMIKQGTDGLSRADHSSGVMQGESMVQHIPLNEDAFVRSPKLHKKFISLLDGMDFTFLKPHQWFDEYHAYGNYVWIPPPAATDAAVDLLNKARHKRPESLHLVVVPRLMTGRWRRALTRTSDTYFKIDWEDSWPLSVYHEPVLCFVCLPLSVCSPNLSCRKNLVARMEWSLSKKIVHSYSDTKKWSLLREFLLEARALSSMPRRFL
mmetsp:Transcript_7983/g.19280  ORF Transcript_7983/g.19280 Transcript_7983/m.19280 type:complete len:1317 (-) Transcript_7983:1541-5491(-)